MGPRGTGKTTRLRAALPKAHWYNLLLDRERLRIMRDPQQFQHEIEALPRGSWVVIDEIQTGSSARRLRREQVNLLAGRVVMRQMLPLTVNELGETPNVDDLLRFGMLPLVRSARGAATRIDLLEAYAEIWTRARHAVGIEVKASTRWRPGRLSSCTRLA